MLQFNKNNTESDKDKYTKKQEGFTNNNSQD